MSLSGSSSSSSSVHVAVAIELVGIELDDVHFGRGYMDDVPVLDVPLGTWH